MYPSCSMILTFTGLTLLLCSSRSWGNMSRRAPAATCSTVQYNTVQYSTVQYSTVDGEVEGGVYHLQQLHRGHGVQVPDGGDALQYSAVQYSTVQAPTQYSDAPQMLVPTLSLAWQRRMEVIITASYTDSNSLYSNHTYRALIYYRCSSPG